MLRALFLAFLVLEIDLIIFMMFSVSVPVMPVRVIQKKESEFEIFFVRNV